MKCAIKEKESHDHYVSLCSRGFTTVNAGAVQSIRNLYFAKNLQRIEMLNKQDLSAALCGTRSRGHIETTSHTE